MGVSFIANVGSRDVVVEGRLNLPKDSRPLGELILSNWDTYKPYLRLPILVKTLDAVLEKHGRVDHILLYASNQADISYRHTDTEPYARIIKRFLQEKYGDWIESALEIVEIKVNPSDYDLMYQFYTEDLQLRAEEIFAQDERVYASISGGTPAMSLMLLWQGVQVLGTRLQPLYVLQEKETPVELKIGRDLLVRSLQANLQKVTSIYQYDAALAILKDNAALLAASLRYYDALCRLVEAANHRVNFNFELAFNALESPVSLPKPYSTQWQQALEDVQNRDEAWLLREEIYGAELDLERGAYKDAVANIFAFREGALRLYAIQKGVQLADENRKLDGAWIDSIDGLRDYLVKKDIDLKRNVTTFVFERVLDYLGKTDASVGLIVKAINGFEELAKIRNDATHSHKGVALDDIAKAYVGGVDAIIPDLRAVYAQMIGQPMAENPFKTLLNPLISSLIEVSA